MTIRITNKDSIVEGFVSWSQLAKEVLPNASEIGGKEHVVRFKVNEEGIHYFVSEAVEQIK